MTEKLIRDGKVAVIYSPGFGAGWSTWAEPQNKQSMVFDPVIAQMIIDKTDSDKIHAVAAERYPNEYLGGLDDCEVVWLPVGTVFEIDEYDGSESIRTTADLMYVA